MGRGARPVRLPSVASGRSPTLDDVLAGPCLVTVTSFPPEQSNTAHPPAPVPGLRQRASPAPLASLIRQRSYAAQPATPTCGLSEAVLRISGYPPTTSQRPPHRYVYSAPTRRVTRPRIRLLCHCRAGRPPARPTTPPLHPGPLPTGAPGRPDPAPRRRY